MPLLPCDLVPLDRPAQPFLEGGAGDEAELLPRPGGVEAAARLAVRLAQVAHDLTPIVRHPADHLHEVVDRDLLPRPDVDRGGLVVLLGGQDDRLGGVVDVEELPGDWYALMK